MTMSRRNHSKNCAFSREELRAAAVRPAMFETLEPRLLLDGSPTAMDDLFEMSSDATSVVVTPLDNDTPDPAALSIESIDAGQYGTISQDGDTWVYTVNEGVTFPGRDTLQYTITDGENTSTATITLGYAPQAETDILAVDEDSANKLDVLDNDVDYSDGETLTLVSVSGAQHGIATLGTNEDGEQVVLYTPDADYYGTESLTYTIEDADGLSSTGTVTLAITNQNDNPVANNDTQLLNTGDTSISFNPTTNDTSGVDPTETLTITAVGDEAQYGTVTFDGNTLTYTLNDGVEFPGEDSFTYTISDGNDGTATATVTILTRPATTDDEFTVDEDTADNELDVLNNDTNVNDSFTITVGTNPSHGTAVVQDNGAGNPPTILYTPDADFQGEDTFTYYIMNGDVAITAGDVTVTVENVNDAPTATDDLVSIGEDDENVTITPLGNDLVGADDPDTLTISAVGDGVNGLLAPLHGTAEISQDGLSIVYTPDVSFDGYDTFEYTIDDGAGGTSTATITVGIAPTAVDDAYTDGNAVDEDSTDIVLDVLANDTNVPGDETSLIVSVSNPANGTAEISGDGLTILYTPDADFQGEDTFTYTLQDNIGLQSTATVTVTVTNLNDAPVVAQEFSAINVNTNHAATTFDLFSYFNDVDDLIYRFASNMGRFDVLLYQYDTPITVANFQQYADSGAYVNSFIHRSVADFVVQGGGYTFSDADGYPSDIEAFDPIVNEFGISNTRGTIAMAKLGDDPDSATSQWFFNLGDNSENLDNQNSGFTVFGEVLENGMDVIDAIAALPTHDFDSPYDTLPMQNYDGESAVTSDNLVLFNSIQEISLLTFTVENTNPDLVTAVINNETGQLTLEYTPNMGGTAQITIRATDASGEFVETTLDIVVNDNPDLVVGFGKVTLPDLPTMGDRGKVQLFVSNLEPYRAQGRIDLQLWASKDGDITNGNGDDYLLVTLPNRSINLAGNRTKAFTANFKMEQTLPDGEYSLVAFVDSGKAMPERYEDNNTAVYETQTYGFYPSFADLQGEITRIKFKNNAMAAGDTGYAYVTVANTGNMTANGKIDISLYMTKSDAATGNDILVGTLENARVVLSAGKFKTYRVKFNIAAEIDPQVYWMYAVVDSGNTVNEACAAYQNILGINPEENNTAYSSLYSMAGQQLGSTELNESTGVFDLQVQRPDLYARIWKTNLSYAPKAGEAGRAYLAVINDSWVRAKGRVNINLYLRNTETGEDILLNTKNNFAVNLAAYRYRRLSLGFRIPSTNLGEPLPEGSYQLVATVTSASAGLQDGDTSNDEYKYSTVYQVRQPFVDLSPSISKYKIYRNPATEGDRAFVQVTIYNKGNSTVRAKGVVTNIWASKSSVLNKETAVLLGTKTMNLGIRPDGKTRKNFVVTLPGSDVLPQGTYYLIAEVDADANPDGVGVVFESSGEDYNAEDNNTARTGKILTVGLPDLTPTLRKITLPQNAVAGATGRAIINVANTGNVRVNSRYDVTLYAQTDGQDDVAVGQLLNRRIALWPNRATSVSVPISTANLPAGDYTIMAKIDSGEAITEVNEDNNEVTAENVYSVQEANVDLTGTLAAPVVVAPATAGDNLTAAVRIQNDGNIHYRNQVKMEFQTDTGEVLGAKTVTLNLAPGRAVNVTHKMPLPEDLAAGTYDVIAVITEVTDEANVTVNAGNNIAGQGALTIGAPNLTAEILGAPLSGTLIKTSAQTVQVKVTNNGNVRSQGSANLQLWATGEGVDDCLLAELTNRPYNLQPGQSTTETLNFTLPADMADGDYELFTVINPTQGLATEVTGDNTSAPQSPFSVVEPQIDLAVTADWNHGIYAGDNNPDTADNVFLRGQTYSMPVSVTNTGNVAATNFDTELQALFYFNETEGWQPFATPVILGTLTIDTLAPGETFTGTLQFMFPTTLPATQTYDMIIKTDADGVVAETNENNNLADPDGLNGNKTYYFAV